MTSFRPPTFTRVIVAIMLLSLSACGGSKSAGTGPGGGGGGGGGGGLPDPDPLASKLPASDFTSAADFSPCFLGADSNIYCNYGLNQIGAQYAYAEGAYGGGVVVAVIDSGIDTTHSELDANISPYSIDIVRGGALTDESGHGTHVAGIIAAERNEEMIHGVAFDATILAIRADIRVTDPVICGGPDPCSVFDPDDVAAGINYAAGRAHVINLSLGVVGTTIDDSLGANVEQSLIDAMEAGAIVVAAAGNEGATEPILPAAYAGDATVNASGQMIAVGAVDDSGVQAAFSNDCGSAMNYCLVAPGVDIISTIPGGWVGLASGTSQAAPHVAGAAALLIQLWPTLSAAEVVDILLTSATDLGDAGVDAVYGHGLLNLQSALMPAGSLEIPLTPLAEGDGAALDGTALTLGPAFGDALANSDLLGQGFALDDYDRNYSIDLNDFVRRAERGFGLQALLDAGGIQAVDSELPGGIKVALGVSDSQESESPADWSGMAEENGESHELHGMRLEIEGGPNARVHLGYDITPEQQVAGLSASEPAGLFWMPGDTLGPQHGLVGIGAGASLSYRLDNSSVLSMGWVDQRDDAEDWNPDAKIGEIMLAHRFSGGIVGYLGYSAVDEQGGFLGGEGTGGFAIAGADTQFYSLGGRYPLGAGVELIGNYTMGLADMREDGSSLLGDWSEIRANAFGAGLVKTGVLGSNDRIGLLAGQPLRVSSGEATITAPVEYLIDKTVVQESERVSMVPSGREIDLQLAYDAPLGNIASLSTWVMMQLEPGHVAGADTAYGAGFRFSAEF